MVRGMLVVTLVLVSACGTTEGYRKAADATVGMTEEQIIQRFGPPQNVHRADGTNTTLVAGAPNAGSKFLTYLRGGSITIPGYYQCVRGFCWVNPPQTYTEVCETTFRIEAGKVAGVTFQGNGCRA